MRSPLPLRDPNTKVFARYSLADTFGAPTAFPDNDVIRNPATGLVTRIDNPLINIGTLSTRGVDFGGTYVTQEYPWGKLDLEVNATYVYGYTTMTPYPPLNGKPVFQVLTNDDQAGGPGLGLGGGPDFKMVAKPDSTPHIVAIRTASLDDPSWINPQVDAWTSDAQPWDQMNPALPKFEKYPQIGDSADPAAP